MNSMRTFSNRLSSYGKLVSIILIVLLSIALNSPAYSLDTGAALTLAQGHIDSVASDFPEDYEGAQVDESAVTCFDYEGNPSALIFDVLKEGKYAGYVTVGIFGEKFGVIESSKSRSPVDSRREWYQAMGKSQADLEKEDALEPIIYISGIEYYLNVPADPAAASGYQYINLSDWTRTHAEVLDEQQGDRNSFLADPERQSLLQDPASASLDTGTNQAKYAPALQVVWPTAAGSYMDRGAAYSILWTASEVADVKIELYKAGILNQVITASVAGSAGSYGWTPPIDIVPGSDYKIKVTDVSNAALYDFSDNNFYITGSKLLAGMEAYTWYRGCVPTSETMLLNYIGSHGFPDLRHTVSSFGWSGPDGSYLTCYTARDLNDHLADLLGFPSSGGTVSDYGATLTEEVTAVRGVIDNHGYGIWSTLYGMDPPADTYRSVVDGGRPGEMGFYSGNPYYNGHATCFYGYTFHTNAAARNNRTIYIYDTWDFARHEVVYESQVSIDYHDVNPPLFVVSYPNAPAISLHQNSLVDLKWGSWASQSGATTVKIELYKGGVLNSTIIDSTTNDGSYAWTVPAGQTIGSDYKIKVISNANATQYDFSNNNFAIEGPAVPEVTYPTASGITWYRSSGYTITWNDFTSPNVKIELYKGGALNRTIIASTANDGSHAWTVPADQATGSDYTIKVTSTTNASEYDESDNSFTIDAPPTARVTYPTEAGVTLHQNTACTITWSDYSGTYVKIDLYKGGVLNRTIATSTANDGSHPWTVAATQTIGSDYKIKITSTSTASQYDFSDDFFAVASPIAVTYPTAAGITWYRNEGYTITWSNLTGSNVRIDLYKGSALNRNIVASIPNTGSYAWTLPAAQATGTDFRIRVSSTTVTALVDFSDNYFTIVAIPTVTYPTAPDLTWFRGSAYNITWNSFTGAYVKIELLKGGLLNRTLSASTTNDGSFSWTVPSDQEIGSDLQVKITSTATPSQYDSSDNDFEIAIPPPPEVTYPTDAQTVLYQGSACNITWSNFTGTYVKIDLYKAGVLNRTIISSTANDGSHPWTVAATQTIGSDYKIKITSTSNTALNDYSDNFFAIANPITVTYPTAAGVTWRRNDAYTVTWENLSGSNVRIDLYKGSVLNRNIVASTPNTGSYEWTVPGAQLTGSDFRIKVSSATNTSVYDFSDNYFTIDAIPTVTYPTAPDLTWFRGSAYNITWNSFTGSYVKIELLKGGLLNRTISASTPNDGSFSWTVTADQEIGSDFRVKITSTTNASQYDSSDNDIEIAIPPPPEVTYPTDAQITLYQNTAYTITWRNFTGTYVKIDLYKAGVLNRTIISSTANDGSHPWTVPATQTVGSDYKIKITSTSNTALNDFSDNFFAIANPITVTYPTAAGLTWYRNEDYTITWENLTGSNVRIDLYKGSVLNRNIVASTPNTGSYEWTIPPTQLTGTDFRIKISSTTATSLADFSDNYFAIEAIPTVTYPSAAGIMWYRGNSYTITWNSFTGSYVLIELFKGGVLNRTIVASTANDGSYAWTVPADQTTGSDFQIKVTSTTNASHYDESENDFTIAIPPPPSVLYPTVAGLTWYKGSAYTITWSDFIGTYVKIELYKGGSLNRTIISSTGNDGSYSWTIPDTQMIGSDFQIKITSTSNASLYDYSDSYFTIQSAIVTLTVDGASRTGNITPAGDEDWYQFTITSAGDYTIDTWGGTIGDNYMYLYGPDSQAALLEQDDDDGIGYMARIIRSLSPGVYYVKVEGYSTSNTGTYYIKVQSGSAIVTLTVNAAPVLGNISPAGDEDWYQFVASTSGTYTIETWAGTLTDNYMYLFGPNNQTAFLEEDDDDGTDFMAKIVRALTPGTYYVKVEPYYLSGAGTYTIRVTY